MYRDDPGSQRSKKELFEKLLREHGDRMYALALRLTGSPDRAGDLAQEVFLRALENIERYNPERPFQNWAAVILRHLYLDWLKRYETSHTVSLDGNGNERGRERLLLDSMAHRDGDPLEQLLRQEKGNTVQKMLQTIPVEFRLPLVLCDMEGLSYEAIAQVIGCPVGTVRSRIHRGRKIFKGLMAQHLKIEDYELRRS